jgi:hypothetical protein
MRNFLNKHWFILIAAGIATFALVFLVCLLATEPSTPAAEQVHTECLDGFEYYARSFRTYYGVGVALAPKWDQDGKPKRCPVEQVTKHEVP